MHIYTCKYGSWRVNPFIRKKLNIVNWEPEEHYHYSTMFYREPEGCYHCTMSTVIAPFCFSTEHHWTPLKPFWFSADDISSCAWHNNVNDTNAQAYPTGFLFPAESDELETSHNLKTQLALDIRLQYTDCPKKHYNQTFSINKCKLISICLRIIKQELIICISAKNPSDLVQ